MAAAAAFFIRREIAGLGAGVEDALELHFGGEEVELRREDLDQILDTAIERVGRNDLLAKSTVPLRARRRIRDQRYRGQRPYQQDGPETYLEQWECPLGPKWTSSNKAWSDLRVCFTFDDDDDVPRVWVWLWCSLPHPACKTLEEEFSTFTEEFDRSELLIERNPTSRGDGKGRSAEGLIATFNRPLSAFFEGGGGAPGIKAWVLERLDRMEAFRERTADVLEWR